MANDNTDFDRLLAGEIGVDDPEWGRVASFLGRVQDGSEPLEVVHLEAAHLDRVRASLPAPGLSPRARRRRWPKTRRLLVGGVAGVLLGLGAGAGVAAAFGVNPVESIARLRMVPIAPHSEPGHETVVPASPSQSHDRAATSVPSPSQRPGQPANSQRPATPPGQANDPGTGSSTHGRSSTHPTPHSSTGAQHGNSSEAPGHTKATAKPSDQSDGKPSSAPSGKKSPSQSQRDKG